MQNVQIVLQRLKKEEPDEPCQAPAAHRPVGPGAGWVKDPKIGSKMAGPA